MWEANRFSAGHEFSTIMWNRNVRYHIYQHPPPAPILSQINSIPSNSLPLDWISPHKTCVLVVCLPTVFPKLLSSPDNYPYYSQLSWNTLHWVYLNSISYLSISWFICTLTLILLTWRIWWALNNASRWQMRLNWAFKWLKKFNH